ncbi:MAG: GNAT family N-acetyltransferase [Sodaliphilus sp.]
MNNSLHVAPAEEAYAPAIWHILQGEIEVMRNAGRNQWQNGYPNPQTVAADIKKGQGRVLLQGSEVMGYCALITSGDPFYDHIWNGNWLTSSDSRHCRYAVVHRIGIAPEHTGKGFATAFLQMLMAEAAAMGCESMRIDTNFDNAQMLHILPKLGFTRCGMVMVKDGERHAFEKILHKQ